MHKKDLAIQRLVVSEFYTEIASARASNENKRISDLPSKNVIMRIILLWGKIVSWNLKVFHFD